MTIDNEATKFISFIYVIKIDRENTGYFILLLVNLFFQIKTYESSLLQYSKNFNKNLKNLTSDYKLVLVHNISYINPIVWSHGGVAC